MSELSHDAGGGEYGVVTSLSVLLYLCFDEITWDLCHKTQLNCPIPQSFTIMGSVVSEELPIHTNPCISIFART